MAPVGPSGHYPGRVPNPVLLSDLTTFRLGGPAPDLTTVRTAAEFADGGGRGGSGRTPGC